MKGVEFAVSMEDMGITLHSTSIEHRPYPLPPGRHAMEMHWHDLLFAHWPVPMEVLRPLIPQRLKIDCSEGQAWIGVVPFWMSGVRVRPFPGMPGATLFPEINVRTYVVEGNKPGVFFFSLDAGSLLAVKAARAWFHLPYYHARIKASQEGHRTTYHSVRRVRADQVGAEFSGSYFPINPAVCEDCGPLAKWLTERYCLYSVSPRGNIYRGDIHHEMWPLQPAEAEIEVNTMTAPLGIRLPDTPPLLHFAKHLEVAAWAPVRVESP